MSAASRGRRNRQRGQEGEREIANILTEHIGPTKRNLGQERDSGTDIGRGQWKLEVKRRKRVAGFYEWMAQAEGNGGHYGAVCIRADGDDWLVCVRLKDFIRCAREELI